MPDTLFRVFFMMMNSLDFILIFLLCLKALLWFKKTHSFKIIKGFFLILVIYFLSDILHFRILHGVLDQVWKNIMVILLILFQPEIRKGLERLGHFQDWFKKQSKEIGAKRTVFIQCLLKTLDTLVMQKIGAIVVCEKTMSLDEFKETGIPIHAALSSELLASLFWKGAPTHDGAAIITEDTIDAAGCLLPLTDQHFSRNFGTRHRAGIGISEHSDAIVLIVSEETGDISVVKNGQIKRAFSSRQALESYLFDVFSDKS